jgi:hypothetical protein
MKPDSTSIVFLVCVLLIAACAARPELPTRSAANPADVDLSGAWEIRVEPGAPLIREGEQPQTIQMPKRQPAQSSQPQQRRQTRSKGLDVWIFLETGKVLRVTQTSDGLFISFDRAVVEEYAFGENRRVSVGPIEAQRVTGWVGAELVIETMDMQGALLTETWALEDGGSVLVREMSITDGGKQVFSARQVFDRA